MNRDFVLEIGTEEIPARFMSGALQELEIKAKKILEKERINYKSLAVYGTPRRLSLYIEELQEVGDTLIEEKKGPSTKVAFDQNGCPTQAAKGFAKGQNVDSQSLVIKDTPTGEYVFAVVKKEGANIRELFPKILPELILSLDFPKPMRWGYVDIKFIRPIRWLLCLYGDETIDIEIEGVKAGNFTNGHRFLGKEKISIDAAKSYFAQLDEEFVIIDQNKRRELVWSQIQQVAADAGGKVVSDNDLLEEINFLLEYPTALCGVFADSYLKLPREVLITVMKQHQKYFPVWGDDGGLLPKFITVRNGDGNYLDIVTEGNQKVLEARLNDAEFFYNEDVKSPLIQKTELLKTVVFQEKLGTMFQKVSRIRDLSSWIAENLNLENNKIKMCNRAAYLAKADLMSNMVYELPELQGIMGYYYALHDKEPEEVALAIKEHYQPRFSGDEVPQDTIGAVVAIADKIDNICGCFAVNLRPSGSGDPYALRRQALGICLIVKEKGLELNLSDLISCSLRYYQKQGLDFDYSEVYDSVFVFFEQRLANLMEENKIKYDVVKCVLSVSWNNINDVFAKAVALTKFKEDENYNELLISYTRMSNLTKKSSGGIIDEKLILKGSEIKLLQKYQKMQEDAFILWQQRSYEEILRQFSSLKPYIDEYFENIMVMSDNEVIKNNRLAMLKNIVDYLAPFGDLTKLLSK